jgi:hypothetical protein
MLKRNLLLLIGLAIYAASFFLPAISSSSAAGGAVRGYLCAWITLTVPWGHDGMNVFHDKPFVYIAILLSGWTNLVFLITTVLILMSPPKKLLAICRVLLLIMLACSWFILYQLKFVPREGHYIWIFGMLLVVFSNELTGYRKVSATA